MELARETEDVILVCDKFREMKDRGLMKDDFHYFQKAYNEIGQAAGKMAGIFVCDLEEKIDAEKQIFDI